MARTAVPSVDRASPTQQHAPSKPVRVRIQLASNPRVCVALSNIVTSTPLRWLEPRELHAEAFGRNSMYQAASPALLHMNNICRGVQPGNELAPW